MYNILILIICIFTIPVFSQEIVTLSTRKSVTQSFFIESLPKKAPGAVGIFFVGNRGDIKLAKKKGIPQFIDSSFFPRTRRDFVRNGVVFFLMDAPSDRKKGAGMSPAFRKSKLHEKDVRAVVAEAKRRYPKLPVFLAGISKSTLSVANLGRQLEGEIAGIVLSSSLFYWPDGGLAQFNWNTLKVPVLLVHHRDDLCEHTPYKEAEKLKNRYPLISVKGSKESKTKNCQAFSPHGFYGKETETVDAISAWMLGKPFNTEL